MDSVYVARLENVVKQMLQPLKDIPFTLVIKAISGHEVVPFNKKNGEDAEILKSLKKVAVKAGQQANVKGIISRRKNEVGNAMESFVKDAMNKIGYLADTPKSKNGKRKAAGYPDIEFKDEFGRWNYLECKTFNEETLDSTQRSFYLSPSDEFKVTKDAHHFGMSFEMLEDRHERGDGIYKCKSWKVMTFDSLCVDVKYEFNSDNKRLYAQERILASGQI